MLGTLRLLSLTLFTLIIIACGAKPSPETTGEYLDSSTVTAKVKARLINKLGTQGFAINVKTYKDEVQLSGFVDQAYVRSQAGKIASTTAHVKRVRNDIIVK